MSRNFLWANRSSTLRPLLGRLRVSGWDAEEAEREDEASTSLVSWGKTTTTQTEPETMRFRIEEEQGVSYRASSPMPNSSVPLGTSSTNTIFSPDHIRPPQQPLRSRGSTVSAMQTSAGAESSSRPPLFSGEEVRRMEWNLGEKHPVDSFPHSPPVWPMMSESTDWNELWQRLRDTRKTHNLLERFETFLDWLLPATNSHVIFVADEEGLPWLERYADLSLVGASVLLDQQIPLMLQNYLASQRQASSFSLQQVVLAWENENLVQLCWFPSPIGRLALGFVLSVVIEPSYLQMIQELLLSILETS